MAIKPWWVFSQINKTLYRAGNTPCQGWYKLKPLTGCVVAPALRFGCLFAGADSRHLKGWANKKSPPNFFASKKIFFSLAGLVSPLPPSLGG